MSSEVGKNNNSNEDDDDNGDDDDDSEPTHRVLTMCQALFSMLVIY